MHCYLVESFSLPQPNFTMFRQTTEEQV